MLAGAGQVIIGDKPLLPAKELLLVHVPPIPSLVGVRLGLLLSLCSCNEAIFCLSSGDHAWVGLLPCLGHLLAGEVGGGLDRGAVGGHGAVSPGVNVARL